MTAVVTPARIAEETDAYTAWRDRPDGALEVATVRISGIDHYLVGDDGTTSWVGHDSISTSGRWIRPAVLATPVGVGLCILTMIGFGTGWLPAERFGWLFVLGMVMASGFVVALESFRPERLLRRIGSGWYEPTKLDGWRPQTNEQLAAVERLADAHGGVAQVRDDSEGGVDVIVRRWSRRTRYVVDVSGTTSRVEPSSIHSREAWREVRTRELDTD